MSRGRISRASRRYPDARRRAARYGRTQAGHRPNGLPPHLLPGVTGRQKTDGSNRLRIAIGAAFLALVAVLVGLVTTVTSTAAGVAGTMRAYEEVNKDLPNAALVVADTYQTTRILDRNGVLLRELSSPDQGAGWRTFVPLSEVSQDLIDATVAAEDATFWSHRGIEPTGILRGLFINVSGSGSSGASTITQQLVRSLYPKKISALDISYTRKGREALAAVALERKYSKQDIMTMYLNQIFYGNRSYGIEAAARTYFHKSAKDLNLAEASLLAGIPQQPTRFNPSLSQENFDAAKVRQDYVLDEMVDNGYITQDEADAAYLETPRIYEGRESDGVVLDHPHFVQYAIEHIQEQYGEKKSKEFLQGGLDIYTTIDTAVQKRAEEIVQANVAQVLEPFGGQNAAMVVMVPYTGEVLAMVGSTDFARADIEGQVNITTSPQQPGSAIKPIVYAAAFEQGWHPGTVVLDAPFKEETPNATDVATGQPTPFYEPLNYTQLFYGAVSVRTALSNSLNIPAVKAVQFVGGPESVVEIARRMGIKHELAQKPSEYGLSIGLGSGDVQPLELTNAYATFANNGKYVPATPILKITDSQGQTLYELDRKKTLEQAQQAIRAEIAYQISSILTDSASRRLIFAPGNPFEATQERLKRQTAAKSGTTNDFKDIWTMGYTTDLAIGVWAGNTRNAPFNNPIDGIQGAAPMWSQMMEEMHSNPEFAKLLLGPDGQPIPGDFVRPPGIYEGVVCEATGGRPTQNTGNRREILIQGGAPAQRCDQMTPWQRGDVAKTMKNIAGGGAAFTGNARQSIDRYLQAVGFRNAGEFYRSPPKLPEGEPDE
jgi:membrane peptidoglycan carboxypeptidase